MDEVSEVEEAKEAETNCEPKKTQEVKQDDAKQDAVKVFKRKLEESLHAGVISEGSTRRKAAAAADERFKEQVAMERGLIRVKKGHSASTAPKREARNHGRDAAGNL